MINPILAKHLESMSVKKMPHYRTIKGFTMVELIAILLLIGIVVIVALPRFFNPAAFNVRGLADQAQSIVRQAQKIAIARNHDVFVNFSSTNIALCMNVNCDTPALSLSNEPITLNLPSDVSLMVQPGEQSAGFHFNALGQPLNIDGSVFKKMTISLASGDEAQVFSVERETGYVHQ